MIVDELHVVGIARHPPKADAPLIVDADTVLAGTVAFELFQPIPRWHAEILQRFGRIYGDQLAQHRPLEIRRIATNAFSVEEALRVPIREALDHQSIITTGVINVNRYYVAS